MKIKELSNLCNVPEDTLRYYDKIGLLEANRKNNIRIYTEADIQKLQKILLMKKMMFTLAEIKRILVIDEEFDSQLVENGQIDSKKLNLLRMEVESKLEDIYQKEKEINIIKEELIKITEKINSIKKEIL